MNKGDKYYPRFQEPSSSVTGVKFGIIRMSDGYWYDFSSSTFKLSGWTTQYQAMSESSNGLWVYPTGWTSPNIKGAYAVQFLVTDNVSEDPAQGEIIEVTDLVQTIVSPIVPETTKDGTLAKIDAAIDAILNGGAVQSYTYNGRNLSRYSLTELEALRKRLVKEINASTSGSRRNYVTFGD